MTDKPKELQIEVLPEVQAQFDADPEMAEAARDFFAKMRQAHEAVQRGQYKTMDDAMEALTGNRPVKLDPETGEPIEGASLHTDMGLEKDDDDDAH